MSDFQIEPSYDSPSDLTIRTAVHSLVFFSISNRRMSILVCMLALLYVREVLHASILPSDPWHCRYVCFVLYRQIWNCISRYAELLRDTQAILRQTHTDRTTTYDMTMDKLKAAVNKLTSASALPFPCRYVNKQTQSIVITSPLLSLSEEANGLWHKLV